MGRHTSSTSALSVIVAVACALVGPGVASTVRAEDATAELDYVALAARLIKDGHFDRAAAALAEVDTKSPELDLPRYHTLLGLVSLKRKDFATARKALRNAIETQTAEAAREAKQAGKAPPATVDPVLWLYLAQASFGLKDYEGTLEVLARAGKRLDDELSVYLMRAQSHWELKQPGKAIAALVRGIKRFPDATELTRARIFYLLELGLFQEVMDLGRAYLARDGASAQDHVAVGEALRRGKQLAQAGLILEAAHLRFPQDQQVLLALAHVYLDQERPLSAAMLLEDAARLDPKYTVEAAELYKQARRLERALSLNARVTDQKDKLKQRLAILLAMERFEAVAAMAPSLSRAGLFEDEDVRYAVAYGYYKIGDFASAERELKRLTRAELLNDANQLRKAMAACRASGWECI